jgi:hypothetical protein
MGITHIITPDNKPDGIRANCPLVLNSITVIAGERFDPDFIPVKNTGPGFAVRAFNISKAELEGAVVFPRMTSGNFGRGQAGKMAPYGADQRRPQSFGFTLDPFTRSKGKSKTVFLGDQAEFTGFGLKIQAELLRYWSLGERKTFPEMVLSRPAQGFCSQRERKGSQSFSGGGLFWFWPEFILLYGRRKIPYQVDFILHVSGFTGDGDHDILVGHHNDILAKSAVSTVSIVTATPHLITITLQPVTGIPQGLSR